MPSSMHTLPRMQTGGKKHLASVDPQLPSSRLPPAKLHQSRFRKYELRSRIQILFVPGCHPDSKSQILHDGQTGWNLFDHHSYSCNHDFLTWTHPRCNHDFLTWVTLPATP